MNNFALFVVCFFVTILSCIGLNFIVDKSLSINKHVYTEVVINCKEGTVFNLNAFLLKENKTEFIDNNGFHYDKKQCSYEKTGISIER